MGDAYLQTEQITPDIATFMILKFLVVLRQVITVSDTQLWQKARPASAYKTSHSHSGAHTKPCGNAIYRVTLSLELAYVGFIRRAVENPVAYFITRTKAMGSIMCLCYLQHHDIYAAD